MSYSTIKQRKYQRKWIARRRSIFFVGECCAECGATEQLELDHIDPTEKVTHNIWSWSEQRRNEELAKCQILCHECHVDKNKLTQVRGSENPSAKLTEEDVLAIRRSNKHPNSLAKEYGVGRAQIYKILRRDAWKHI